MTLRGISLGLIALLIAGCSIEVEKPPPLALLVDAHEAAAGKLHRQVVGTVSFSETAGLQKNGAAAGNRPEHCHAGRAIGAPPCIINAIADALAPLGAEVRSQPLGPADIVALIESAGP